MRKPMTLRLLPVGFDFYLVRTGQRYTLVSAGPSPLGGIKYTVKRAGAKGTSVLHHSCHIKPVVRRETELISSQNDQQGPRFAKQGHRYLWKENHVLALETGARVRILVLDLSGPWNDYTTFASAAELTPQPMVYFGNQIPQ